jgi:hypothetical protein
VRRQRNGPLAHVIGGVRGTVSNVPAQRRKRGRHVVRVRCLAEDEGCVVTPGREGCGFFRNTIRHARGGRTRRLHCEWVPALEERRRVSEVEAIWRVARGRRDRAPAAVWSKRFPSLSCHRHRYITLIILVVFSYCSFSGLLSTLLLSLPRAPPPPTHHQAEHRRDDAAAGAPPRATESSMLARNHALAIVRPTALGVRRAERVGDGCRATGKKPDCKRLIRCDHCGDLLAASLIVVWRFLAAQHAGKIDEGAELLDAIIRRQVVPSRVESLRASSPSTDLLLFPPLVPSSCYPLLLVLGGMPPWRVTPR